MTIRMFNFLTLFGTFFFIQTVGAALLEKESPWCDPYKMRLDTRKAIKQLPSSEFLVTDVDNVLPTFPRKTPSGYSIKGTYEETRHSITGSGQYSLTKNFEVRFDHACQMVSKSQSE